VTIAIQPESSPRPRSPMRARLLQALAQRRAAPPGIPRRDPATGPVPASYAQAGLWLVTQLEQGPSAYNVPLPVRLRGRLDVAALRGALTGVAARHEALRTTFTEQDGQVYQSIAGPAPVPLPVTDLTAADDAAREQAVARELTAAQTEPFDLFAGPVLRAGLLRLAPEEHLLLLTVHHIACDGWSVPILHAELAAGYNAAVRGTAADLPPLPVQYADYARWQREQLDPAELGRLTSYWRRRLDGAALTLPTDRPDGPAASTRGGMCSVPVPAEITARLDAIAREAGASRFMTVTGLLSLVLAGYTGQRDLLLGSTHAQRQQPELQSLIGLFNNAFPVRSDVSGNPSFRQLLARARRDLVADYQGSALPFGLLVDALRPERSGNRTPLIRVHFQLEERAGTATAYEQLPDWDGLTAQGLVPEFVAAKFDLNFMVRADQEAMALDLVYSTDLFDAATAGQLAGQFARTAAAVGADPDRGIEDLLLPALGRPQASITVSAAPAAASPVPASPVPASSDAAPAAGEPAPELLARVLDAWRQALGRDDVHPYADFFDIGGSSFTAIKVRRLLGGTVPLAELFRHRTAAALAAYLGGGAPDEDAGRLLWSLTPDESSATTTIVAIPYAGGNATVYQPLADALPPRFRLWAASLPGHEGEEDFIEFSEATRQLAAEVRCRVAGPVIVYGHCAGASLAVALAQELEEGGADLKAVYVGASLTDPDAAQNLSRVTDSPSEELYEYIKAIGGFDGPLDDADRRQVIAALRHDMAGATQFQAAGHAAADDGTARRLQAPVHCVLGAADPVTPDPEHSYAGWSVFGDTVTLDVIDGGHYFARDHAADLAGVIDRTSRQAVPSTVPVICLPHTGAGASFFHPWQQQLAGQADIIAPDLAGHEKRFGDEPHRTTAEAVADLLPRVLAALGERDDVVVFGHCLGATVAFELAEGLIARGVRIRHLILSGAPGPTVPRQRRTTGLPDEEFLARLEELASYSHPALADPEMAALLLPVLRADQEMYETYQRASVEPLDVPVTVLRGSADQLVSAADTEQWQQATTQPVRYRELAGGHMYLADDAGTVLDLIAEVARTPAAGSAPQPDPNPAPAPARPEPQPRSEASPAPAEETTPDATPEPQTGPEVSQALAEERLAALLAAEYPQPDWGLPDAGAPARHECSEDLGAVSDACVLAAVAVVLGRYHGLPVTALAVREPHRADAAPPGPALVALPTGLQAPAGDLLAAAAQALDVPWPRLDDTLTAMLGGTAEDSATGNSAPVVELRFGLHGEPDGGRALTLTVVAAPGQHLRLLAAARRDVIGPRAAVQFTRSVAHVAGQLAAAGPDAGLDSLELLSDAERVLVRRLGTARREPPAESRRIDQLVADRAAAAPSATAITDGRSRLSYGALDTAASRTAHALR
jgi:surfactin synthase thioesterase subunit